MGRWKANTQTWYETNVLNCSLCGQMIPSRIWVAEVDGKERMFCGPGCEDQYHSYWEPRYGKREQPAIPGQGSCVRKD
ncbi:MAG: hypothetical protein ACYC3S_10470 [Chloroflexota bacterium]